MMLHDIVSSFYRWGFPKLRVIGLPVVIVSTGWDSLCSLTGKFSTTTNTFPRAVPTHRQGLIKLSANIEHQELRGLEINVTGEVSAESLFLGQEILHTVSMSLYKSTVCRCTALIITALILATLVLVFNKIKYATTNLKSFFNVHCIAKEMWNTLPLKVQMIDSFRKYISIYPVSKLIHSMEGIS